MGLKTVRELVLRCPLVMSGELLSDLAQYKKFREKEVASAARWVRGRDGGAQGLVGTTAWTHAPGTGAS